MEGYKNITSFTGIIPCPNGGITNETRNYDCASAPNSKYYIPNKGGYCPGSYVTDQNGLCKPNLTDVLLTDFNKYKKYDCPYLSPMGLGIILHNDNIVTNPGTTYLCTASTGKGNALIDYTPTNNKCPGNYTRPHHGSICKPPT